MPSAELSLEPQPHYECHLTPSQISESSSHPPRPSLFTLQLPSRGSSKRSIYSDPFLRLEVLEPPSRGCDNPEGRDSDRCDRRLRATRRPQGDMMVRRWARMVERGCCMFATYLPLAFVYTLTSWGVWVLVSIGNVSVNSSWIGMFSLNRSCPSPR